MQLLEPPGAILPLSLDLFHEHFGPRPLIFGIPGRKLIAYGEELAAKVDHYDFTKPLTGGAYYGGWPSANFHRLNLSGVVASALLYEDSVLVRDPIIDWFTLSMHANRHLIAEPAGWLREDGSVDMRGTRVFLANVIPELERLAPLEDAGVIRYMALDREVFKIQAELLGQLGVLSGRFIHDPMMLAREFAPQELTTGFGLRGFFTFAGGDWEEQTKRALDHALYYFLTEFTTTTRLGARYIAPFKWENWLVSQLGSQANVMDPVRTGISCSQLPAFRDLNPSRIAELHADDSITEIRQALTEAYRDLHLDAHPKDFQAELAERERIFLQPAIAEAERSLKRGKLEKFSSLLWDNKFSVASAFSGLVVDQSYLALVGIAIDAAFGVIDGVQSTASTKRAWSALLDHAGTPESEILDVTPVEGERNIGESSHPWGLLEEPGLSVTVSPGLLAMDHVTTQPLGPFITDGYIKGDYRPCDCASTLKFKFCCK